MPLILNAVLSLHRQPLALSYQMRVYSNPILEFSQQLLVLTKSSLESVSLMTAYNLLEDPSLPESRMVFPSVLTVWPQLRHSTLYGLTESRHLNLMSQYSKHKEKNRLVQVSANPNTCCLCNISIVCF